MKNCILFRVIFLNCLAADREERTHEKRGWVVRLWNAGKERMES